MLINKDILNVQLPSAVDSAEGQAWLQKMAGAALGPSRNDNGVSTTAINDRASVMHTNAINSVAASGVQGPAVDTAIIQEILRQTEMAIDAYNRDYTAAVEAQQKKIVAQTSFPAMALARAKAGVFTMQPANDAPALVIMPPAPKVKAA